MSLQRFSNPSPSLLKGIEDSFPPEMQDGIAALVARLDASMRYQMQSLRGQAVCDPSIVPALQVDSTLNVATNRDVEDAFLMGVCQ